MFKLTPTERPYGIEAIFDDNSGNWIQLLRMNVEGEASLALGGNA